MCFWTFLETLTDLVLTCFSVFSAEVVCQTCYHSLQSCFSFLIPVVFLSLQHKYSIEKAESLTEIVSSLEFFLLEQRCNMHWLEWLNKTELGTGGIFPSCPCFISLWALHCTVTQTWADLWDLHNCGVWSFHLEEDRGSVSSHMSNLFAANYRILKNIKPPSQTPQSL